jgi:parallel beta-helix repeat protein
MRTVTPKPWRRSAAIGPALLCLAALVAPTAADTLHVPGEYSTIQAAIEAALDGDMVEIADGTYTGAGNRDLDFLGKAITVRGVSGDPALCIIDCEQDGRGFHFHTGEGSDSIAEGLTITGGRITGDGGGICCTSASNPTLNQCIISNCVAFGSGGGVHCAESSSPTFTACTISENTATTLTYCGGGVNCESGASPTFTDCTITGNNAGSGVGGGVLCVGGVGPAFIRCTINDNTANEGGGVHCEQAAPSFTDCDISGNTGRNDAGGVCCDGANATFDACTITGNTAEGDGAGVFCRIDRNSEFIDCAISGNTTRNDGGGVRCYGSSPTFLRCTITGNSTERMFAYGGGVYCSNVSDPIFTACLIADNYAERGGGFSCFGACDPVLVNCEISSNLAGSIGGGIFLGDGCSLAVHGCTISNNASSSNGGGLYCSGTAEMHNSILWGNSPQQVFLNDGDAGLEFCDIQGGWAGAGNIDAEPLFVDPDGLDDNPDTWEDNDYRLAPGSPCIDAGDNQAVPADTFDLDGDGDTAEPVPIDLKGNPRFVDDPDTVDTGNPGAPGPLVDMGAYEYQAVVVCPGDLDGDGDTDQSDLGILLGSYGIDGGGDLDGDGDTDQSDLGILLADYGCTP